MSSDSTILKHTCTSKGTTDPAKAAKLQLKMGFRYRQAIGELMFAAVTYRTEVIFSNNPSKLEQCKSRLMSFHGSKKDT